MFVEIILLLFIVFLIIIFIALFIKLSFPIEHDIKEFSIIKSGNGQNMNLCPIGCNRGSCQKLNNKQLSGLNNYCKYNFQCNYCQDRVTNQFYVHPDLTNEKEILPIYEESKYLVINQTDLLNEDIKKNNEYIIDINNKIKKMNS
jgi:hypothetical protein